MKRPFLFFLLSGIAAMLAALVVYSALQQREAALKRASEQSVNIVVAARALPIGAKIDSHAVKLVMWPRDALPPGSFTSQNALDGAYAKNAFVENEPMVASKLFMGQKSAGVMPLLIPAGMRAMSVPVDKVSDVAGFVQPRTHVDVLVAMTNSGPGREKPFSKTILENVEVLAVNQEIQGDPQKPKVVEVVTLLVNPQEAERLALASRQGGNLRLAIRSYDDDSVVLTRGSDIADLERVYSQAPAPVIHSQRIVERAVRARPAPAIGVQIFRDGKSSQWVSFIKASDDSFVREPQTAHHARRATLSENSNRNSRRKVAEAATHPGTNGQARPVALIGSAPGLAALADSSARHSESSPLIDPSARAINSPGTPKTIDVP